VTRIYDDPASVTDDMPAGFLHANALVSSVCRTPPGKVAAAISYETAQILRSTVTSGT
jgi:hypothetical protein